MRHFILDKYNTWEDWRLTLTAKSVAPPAPKTNYIKLDGANGSLDLSEALTGRVAYDDRTVTASFWTSEGTHADRLATLRDIILHLHGHKVHIVEPDDPTHYFVGRIEIKDPTLDQVHLEFKLEAICDPWRYAANETERLVTVDGDEVSVVLNNDGARAVSPTITATGTVTLTYNGETYPLTDGSYQLAGVQLGHGPHVFGVSGTGSVLFTYREADL